jgi:hypothetical protein
LIILNSGTFSFSKTKFIDILINGNYGFISAVIEPRKIFVINECLFIRCYCLGRGIRGTVNICVRCTDGQELNTNKDGCETCGNTKFMFINF